MKDEREAAMKKEAGREEILNPKQEDPSDVSMETSSEAKVTVTVKAGKSADKSCCCHGDSSQDKITIRDDQHKRKMINRLRRIQGQVRGIEAMVERDAYCNDILQQSAAVNAAINAFNRELISNHMRSCVSRDIREGNEEIIDEFVATLQKLMK